MDTFKSQDQGNEVKKIVWRNRYEKTFEAKDGGSPTVSNIIYSQKPILNAITYTAIWNYDVEFAILEMEYILPFWIETTYTIHLHFPRFEINLLVDPPVLKLMQPGGKFST